MLIGLLSKYWRNILDAVLIIAVIVGVFLFNPFGMFGSGLKLESTANLLSNVKAIGQLVTAEYYGEVIASLDESELNFMEEDQLSQRAEDFYIWLKYLTFNQYNSLVLDKYDENDLIKNNRKVRKSMEEVGSSISNIYNSDTPTEGNLVNRYASGGGNLTTRSQIIKTRVDTADIILMYLAQEVFGDRIKLKKYIDPKKRDRLRKDQLNNIISVIRKQYSGQSQEEFAQYLTQGFESNKSFSEFYYEYKEVELKKTKGKKHAKKKLAMIGRGSVKAGFDFGKLDENRFKYDEATATVHLFGVEAKILDSEINPWFIPERQIPGFDILSFNGKVTFEDAQIVKGYCKRKLEKYAREANIIQEANTFGEEGLKSFFSLLTGQEIKEVKFHADELIFAYELIARDTLISIDEIEMIETIILNHQKKQTTDPVVMAQRKAMLTNFISQLKMLKLQVSRDELTTFNYYNKFLPALLLDSIVDQTEMARIDKIRPSVLNEDAFYFPSLSEEQAIWFEDSLSIITDYNAMITFLESYNKVAYYDVKTTTDSLTFKGANVQKVISDISSNMLESNEAFDSTRTGYLSYSLNGSVITKTEIVRAINPQYESKFINLNLDNTFVENIRKSGDWPDDTWPEIKASLNKKEPYIDSISIYLKPQISKNGLQLRESLAYQKWLISLSIDYQNEGAIVHASDWMKERFLNGKTNSIKKEITSRLSSYR